MTIDKNTRAAWATLNHDSLSAQVGKHTPTVVQFFFLNFGLMRATSWCCSIPARLLSPVCMPVVSDPGVSLSHASMQTMIPKRRCNLFISKPASRSASGQSNGDNGFQMVSGVKEIIPGVEHWPRFMRNS